MTFPRPLAVRASRRGFTLIELLTVITIIVILVSLVIGAAGFANTKAARARAEGEIKALSAAAENYKSDNGIYPRSTETDNLDAKTSALPTNYVKASRDLYAMLSGQIDATSGAPLTTIAYPPTITTGMRSYWGDLKPSMLGGVVNGVSTNVTAINDPYGLSYGYSTANQKDAETATIPADQRRGYNPTFDLWSVANKTSTKTDAASLDTTVRPVWITNW